MANNKIYYENAMEDIHVFLERALSERQKKILSIIQKTIGQEAVELYKAACYAYLRKIPCYQMVTAHAIRELFNALTRKDEEEYKNQIKSAIDNLPFIQLSNPSEDSKNKALQNLFNNISYLYNEQGKIKAFILEIIPTIEEKELNQLLSNTFKAKTKLEKLRHFNGKLKTYSDEEFMEAISQVEDFIIFLAPTWSELKQRIDSILKSAREKDTLKDSQIKFLSNNLNADLSSYFFSQLENVKWFEKMVTTKLLYPKECSFNNIVWPALPYLNKILPTKSKEIATLIQSIFVSENLFASEITLSGLLSIACKISKSEKTIFLDIYQKLTAWLKTGGSIPPYIDKSLLLDFIVSLRNIGETEKGHEFATLLVSLKLSVKENLFTKSNDYAIFPKFSKDPVMNDYFYEQFLSSLEQAFQKEKLVFFKLCYYALENVFECSSLSQKDYKNLDWKICFNRSAIENHSQDRYNNSSISLLINKIRDSAVEVFKNNSTQEKKEIISLLENSRLDIFKRILLYLIRIYPKFSPKLIESYLVNRVYFDGTLTSCNVHHEYYLLLQQEFKNLSQKSKKCMLKYIKEGPFGKIRRTASEKEYWKFCKLFCISNDLTGTELQKYKKLLIKFKDVPEHPDFLHYMSSTFGFISPKTADDFSKMSFDEIMAFLNTWVPEKKNFGEPSIEGLSNVLREDIKKNPEKYLNNLASFKKLKEANYITDLFWSLTEISNLSQNNWNDIIDLIAHVCLRNSKGDLDKTNALQQTCIFSARLLSKYFREQSLKEKVTIINLSFIKQAFSAIRSMVLMDDTYLAEQPTIQSPTDYYQRAINSLHGEALDSLIQYGLWQNKVKKKYNDITLLLDSILSKRKYFETYAVLGRYLPWLNLINHTWFKNHLNILLPENNSKIFDVVFLTYINFVRPFDDMYDILKDKIQYALTHRVYSKEEVKEFGKYIAVYYAHNKINLRSKIIQFIFKSTAQTHLVVSVLEFIAHSLSDLAHKKTSKIFISRFQKLWEYYISSINGNEDQHIDGLKTFLWWYQSDAMENGWALSQLYNIVNNHQIMFDLVLLEKQLLADFKKYPEKVLEIIEKTTLNQTSCAFENNLLINIFMQIKSDPTFSKLKKKKDELIKKLDDKFGFSICDKIDPFLG